MAMSRNSKLLRNSCLPAFHRVVPIFFQFFGRVFRRALECQGSCKANTLSKARRFVSCMLGPVWPNTWIPNKNSAISVLFHPSGNCVEIIWIAFIWLTQGKENKKEQGKIEILQERAIDLSAPHPQNRCYSRLAESSLILPLWARPVARPRNRLSISSS